MILDPINDPDNEPRFWAKVDRSGDCWLWTAAKDKSGYGRFGVGRGVIKAHRMAWMLTKEPIPVGVCVLHICDTPPCVNPSHLRLGTHAENSADMCQKGRSASGDRNGTHTKPESRARGNRNGAHTRPDRMPRGEAHGMSVLTAAQALAIRSDDRLYRMIAADYGVSRALISMIKNGKSWAHLAESTC